MQSAPRRTGKCASGANTTPGHPAIARTGDHAARPASLGYEWDIDADNGFRPRRPGAPLSPSTYKISGNFLLDYGSDVWRRDSHPSRNTLYRAPSGALVFGAGNHQLDAGICRQHARQLRSPAFPSDVRFQQATLNLFADMGVQPGAIQAGLIPASRSTDLTPPTSAITSPSAGATVTVGVPVTVSGTATDGRRR